MKTIPSSDNLGAAQLTKTLFADDMLCRLPDVSVNLRPDPQLAKQHLAFLCEYLQQGSYAPDVIDRFRQALGQVLMLMLGHGFNHTARCRITILVQIHPDYVHVSVSDNGRVLVTPDPFALIAKGRGDCGSAIERFAQSVQYQTGGDTSRFSFDIPLRSDH